MPSKTCFCERQGGSASMVWIGEHEDKKSSRQDVTTHGDKRWRSLCGHSEWCKLRLLRKVNAEAAMLGRPFVLRGVCAVSSCRSCATWFGASHQTISIWKVMSHNPSTAMEPFTWVLACPAVWLQPLEKWRQHLRLWGGRRGVGRCPHCTAVFGATPADAESVGKLSRERFPERQGLDLGLHMIGDLN